MKAFKQYLLVLILGLLAVPSMAGEKMTIDMKEILWGHIKDSYEWHITNVGDHPVVINLPVIVKSSTGWHVFSSSQFSHHADEQGNRPGPYGLCIKGGEAETYPGKIVEQVNGQEVRPFDSPLQSLWPSFSSMPSSSCCVCSFLPAGASVIRLTILLLLVSQVLCTCSSSRSMMTSSRQSWAMRLRNMLPIF